eukprot:TRINITY_DN2739_c0_g1_i4.p3 TRINITY_DN2739_c0_g1~~TRINITY_DN2739_c0_g1_i4.p3  ORF type:complete len:124 (+),score=48.35 TRINITY_DN2739_c0_g1_i4:144-515(+)
MYHHANPRRACGTTPHALSPLQARTNAHATQVEVPQQKVDAAAEALRGCMETAAVLRVPLRVNLSVGTRWGSLAPLRPATAAAAATDAAATAAPAAQDSDDDGAQWAADDADDFDEGGGFGVL